MVVIANALMMNNKNKKFMGGGGDLTGVEHKIIIKLPTLPILSLLVRSLLLIAAIASFPWIRSAARNSVSQSDNAGAADFLQSLFHDLHQNGLLMPASKALVIGQLTPILTAGDLNLDISYRPNSVGGDDYGFIPDQTFDFIYAAGFAGADFVDRTLKTRGIAAIQLGGDPVTAFRVPAHFEIVYVRQFDDATIVAIRKLATADAPNAGRRRLLAAADAPNAGRRRLLAVDPAAKRAALDGLEDALLEPLRSPSRRSKQYLKRIRYLPQLTGDSLAAYPRRVFITVGGADGWLERNYPSMSREFEQYRVEAVAGGEGAPAMSEWLRENVKVEEYVVMKAEAEVVEELVKSNAIELVDELFLECSHQGGGGKKSVSRRAYWECVALYGKLRDQGVAVHQWWS